MAKPKILFLTSISVVANEKGLKKIENLEKGESDGSLPKSWYTEQNLRPPKDARDDEDIDDEGVIHLEEDEIEYIEDDIILERSDFSRASDSQITGLTTVFTKTGDSFQVLEDTNFIFEMLYVLDQTLFEKICNDIKWRVKRIFKKEKDLVLELPKDN